jgi:hypothetical protein
VEKRSRGGGRKIGVQYYNILCEEKDDQEGEQMNTFDVSHQTVIVNITPKDNLLIQESPASIYLQVHPSYGCK